CDVVQDLRRVDGRTPLVREDRVNPTLKVRALVVENLVHGVQPLWWVFTDFRHRLDTLKAVRRSNCSLASTIAFFREGKCRWLISIHGAAPSTVPRDSLRLS